MCSYNKINHLWSCENPETLTRHLRDLLGFKGYVMSDWGATHSVSVAAGLDQEQDGEMKIFTQDALKDVDIELINRSVKRIFTPFFELGVLDTPRTPDPLKNVKS